MIHRMAVLAVLLAAGCSGPEAVPASPPVLILRGSPEEMGRTAGLHMKGRIQALVRDYLPGLLGSGSTRAERLRQARDLEPSIPERHRRELKALCEAAEVPYEDLLMANCAVELVDAMLCSVAVVPPDRCAEGETLFGRNLDWMDALRLGPSGTLMVVHPEKGIPFLSVGYPGLVGVFTGVNARGVGAANLVVRKDAKGPAPGIPYAFLLRSILEEAASVAEAEGLLRTCAFTTPQNLAIADRSGGDVFECRPGRIRKRSGEGCRAVTNAFGEDLLDAPGDRYAVLADAWESGETDAVVLTAALRAASIKPMNIQCCLFRLGTMKAEISIGQVPASDVAFASLDLCALLAGSGP